MAEEVVLPVAPAGCTCTPGPGAMWTNDGLALVHHEACELRRWVQDGINIGAIPYDRGSEMLGLLGHLAK